MSDDIRRRAASIFTANHALSLATTGGAHSPWVLGTYFAEQDLKLFTFLEASGKSIENLRLDPRVAFLVSQNDAMKDFLQGQGRAHLLESQEEPRIRALLEAKMPWFKTYTPVVPIRIDIQELFVSSFELGWFPARHIAL